MQQPLTVTPEEVLAVVNEMYPKELDRAIAELTIRKQNEQIEDLRTRLEEAEHSHSHEHDGD